MNHDTDMKQTAVKNDYQALLIYDGECGFCVYWARYWQKLTGNTVNYKPYQEVGSQFPSISTEEFQRAVQYVSPDGAISSAAKASFLTLSHASNKRFWLTLYQKLPGFAFIAEKAYAFIASHRSFFYWISLLLWGQEHEPSRYNLVSWLFLRGLGIIFLIAFVSFSIQALGLIGSQGIMPISELVDAAFQQFGAERYWLFPMLFWLNTSDYAILAVGGGGILFSLLLIFNVLPRISLLFLYLFYLSFCCAGQFFMAFQWDMYLLETSIIAFFLVCYQSVGIWLLRWLLFRFMFAAGLVKWLSGDPTWQNFSALNYYFVTQPLPTPLAWYAQHLPQIMLKIGSATTLLIELIVPFLIFFPRRLRFVSAFFILLLQVLILITGNYNFFNLLTILLCITLFDDAALQKVLPLRWSYFLREKIHVCIPNKITSITTYLFAVATVFISLTQFYLRFSSNASLPLVWINNAIAPLRFINIYGPFAVITTRRMEIVIEGSNDGITWREYSFKYKPGDVNRRPLWNTPHQPRLDWQMWFAALGSIDNNQWFLRVLQRILEGSPPVLALLGNNPFPDKPPQYIRALFYDYHFTNSEEKKATGAWWTRQLIGNYVPIAHLKSP